MSESDASEEWLPFIASLPKLKTLCVAATQISVEDVARLRCGELRILDASDCPGEILDLTREGFGGQLNLSGLALARCKIRKVVLEPETCLTNLKSLDIRGTFIELSDVASAAPYVSELAIDYRGISNNNCLYFRDLHHLSKLIVGIDNSVQLINNGVPAEIKVGSAVIVVSSASLPNIEAELNELLKSQPQMLIVPEGRIATNIYELRRVYAREQNDSGGS